MKPNVTDSCSVAPETTFEGGTVFVFAELQNFMITPCKTRIYLIISEKMCFFSLHSSLTIDPLSIDLCLFLILAQHTLKFKPTKIVSLDLCTLGSVKINLIFLKPLSELIFVYSFLSLLCHGHVVGRREKSLRFLLFSIILFLVLFYL